MTKYLTLIILATFSSLHAQVDETKGISILGTWRLCDKITGDSDMGYAYPIPRFETDSVIKEKKEPLPKEIYTFDKWGYAIIEKKERQRRFIYRTMLKIGDTTYYTTWLTRDTLLLQNTGIVQNTVSLTTSLLILCRSDSKGNTSEKIQSEYPNGQLKFSGQKIGDKLNGIWKEWYENGSVKSVAHYKENVLIMKIEFDKTGKIISETYYD